MICGESPVLKGHDFTGCGKTRIWICFVTGYDFSRAVTAAKCVRALAPAELTNLALSSFLEHTNGSIEPAYPTFLYLFRSPSGRQTFCIELGANRSHCIYARILNGLPDAFAGRCRGAGTGCGKTRILPLPCNGSPTVVADPRGMKLCPIHRTSLFLSDGWESAESSWCFVLLNLHFCFLLGIPRLCNQGTTLVVPIKPIK